MGPSAALKTSLPTLASWSHSSGGVTFCTAAVWQEHKATDIPGSSAAYASSIRPPVTSWGIVPRSDHFRSCGCSDIELYSRGRGAYYGGFADCSGGHGTSSASHWCSCHDGGWGGLLDSGQSKNRHHEAITMKI